MEQEGAALRQRQLLEAVQQLLAGAAPERELLALRCGTGRRRPVLPRRGVGLPRLVAFALEGIDRDLAAAFAQEVDDAVMGEREEPGAECGPLRLPAIARVDDAQPGVLEDLVGLRRQRARRAGAG